VHCFARFDKARHDFVLPVILRVELRNLVDEPALFGVAGNKQNFVATCLRAACERAATALAPAALATTGPLLPPVAFPPPAPVLVPPPFEVLEPPPKGNLKPLPPALRLPDLAPLLLCQARQPPNAAPKTKINMINLPKGVTRIGNSHLFNDCCKRL
jgi:hypothetical protein